MLYPRKDSAKQQERLPRQAKQAVAQFKKSTEKMTIFNKTAFTATIDKACICLAMLLMLTSVMQQAKACECPPERIPSEEEMKKLRTDFDWSKHRFRELLRKSELPHVFIADTAIKQPEAMTIDEATERVVAMPTSPRYLFRKKGSIVLKGSFPKDGMVDGGSANCNQRLTRFGRNDQNHPRRWIIFANAAYVTNICLAFVQDASSERALREAIEELHLEAPKAK
jgi:hypothetical protein